MKKPKRKVRLKKSQAIIFFLTLCFITGITAGFFSVFTMNEQNIMSAKESIVNYINRVNSGDISPAADVFLSSLLTHATTAVLIWALAFLKFGGLIILPVFMFTGARFGFSTALLIRAFEWRGLLHAALIYLPQALILIPTYFLISYFGIDFSLTSPPKKQYIFKLLIALFVITLVSTLDIFVLNFAEGRLL